MHALATVRPTLNYTRYELDFNCLPVFQLKVIRSSAPSAMNNKLLLYCVEMPVKAFQSRVFHTSVIGLYVRIRTETKLKYL